MRITTFAIGSKTGSIPTVDETRRGVSQQGHSRHGVRAWSGERALLDRHGFCSRSSSTTQSARQVYDGAVFAALRAKQRETAWPASPVRAESGESINAKNAKADLNDKLDLRETVYREASIDRGMISGV